MARIKRIARRLPLVPSIHRWYTSWRFSTSQSYWEKRYAGGGNSGGGSYGRLAEFKAEILNRLVREHEIASVLELGCGDGHQLSLAEYPHYTGLDVSRHAIERCRERFRGDSSKRFMHYDATSHDTSDEALIADASLSLDVIYHLVEDPVFETYMRHLFAAARRLVIIYSSNDPQVHETGAHVRHRRFSDWIALHAPEWRLSEEVANRHPFDANDPDETSSANFYIFERATG